MATTPSTIVLFTEDKIHFPLSSALVVMKQLFQYGVRKMYCRGDKIFINLSYTPRATTLKRKFGNLPVRYMRAKIEKDEEFKILENVVKRYKFNLINEDLEEQQQQQYRIEAGSSSSNRKVIHHLEPPPSQPSSSRLVEELNDEQKEVEDVDEKEMEPRKKQKTYINNCSGFSKNEEALLEEVSATSFFEKYNEFE